MCWESAAPGGLRPFTRTRPADEVAPRAAVRGTAIEPRGSTHGGRLPRPPAIPKSDVRRIQPAHSSHNADFAGLSDFREIALAEIQICPDDGGWVAVGQIEQID